MLSSKSVFSLSSFTLIKRLFISSSLSAIRVVSSAYLKLLIFLLAILLFQLVIHWVWHFTLMCSVYKLNKQGVNYTALMYSFLNFEPVHCSMSGSVVSWSIYRFLRRQVGWSGIFITLRIFQFVMLHKIKDFRIVNEAEVDVFLELPAISMTQQMAIWSLVPPPLWNSASTSGFFFFLYCWNLVWRILSTTLLACEMTAAVWWFEHSLALPFFGTGMKTDLF